MKNRKITIIFLALFFIAISVSAQTGGNFTITQSVIASGGGQQSTGGTFSLDGTIGQPLAGDILSGSPFAVTSGFWNFTALLAPTAAGVSISGRIKTDGGKGILNVQLMLTNTATGEVFYARSGALGAYRFDDITVGQTYILTVIAKHYTFNPNTQVINLLEELKETDFIGTSAPKF